MARVPLGFRGVAVLLLAASTVAGQTPEPPEELPLEPLRPQTTDLLRQFSRESHHPLLSLLVDGELTSLDAATQAPKDKDSSRLAPTPDNASAKPKLTEVPPGAIEIDGDGLDGANGLPEACPEAPNCLPFACPSPPPPPCYCGKCKHRCRRQRCSSNCPCEGNPYLGWPCDMGGYSGCCPSQGCGHKCRRQRCGGCSAPFCGYACGGCGAGGYGGGYGCGYGGYGGFTDGCGCTPYIAPAPPPPCGCRKCQRKSRCGHQGCGQPCCGYPGYGGDGFMEGGCGGGCSYGAPPSCSCRRCQRKQRCSHGCGYANYGYPCWPAYPVPGWNMVEGGYNSFTNPSCFGCGKHCGCGCWTHCSRCHCGRVPTYPRCAYPTVMPCMAEMGSFGDDGAFEGDFNSAPILSGPGY